MEDELRRQESFKWDRSHSFSSYNKILGQLSTETVIEHARKPNLLDLACGDGTLTGMYLDHFDQVVGVDASKEHIKKARTLFSNISFHVSLIETFETDDKFATIAMNCILEHVIYPIDTLEKASHHLQPDGVIIVIVPNALGVNRRIAKLMGSLKDEYELSPYDIDVLGHRRSYDRQLLIKDMEGAGLKVIKSGGIFYKMLSTPQINWLLTNGLWKEGGYGWGRVGEEKSKDWRIEFCRACYEYGKSHPDECNMVYGVGTKN